MPGEMENMVSTQPPHGKKIASVVVGLILLCAILYFARGIVFKKHNLASYSTQDVLQEIPKGTPIEQNAKEVLGTATTSPESGKEQYNVVFNSEKTTEQNYKIYKDYCSQNGWTIKNDSKTQLVCEKKGQTMSVTFNHALVPVLTTASKDNPQTGESSIYIKYIK